MSRTHEAARLVVERIGGIDETAVELRPGVSVLTGRNATNRTSLLQGLMAALGSDNVSLKSDAQQGLARLRIDGETYERRLERVDGDLTFEGEPYVAETTVADLFAFLLESNEARRAVAEGGDLRDLIMRSVDTDAVRERIRELRSDHRDLQDRIDEIAALESDLPELREREAELDDTIADLESELATERERLERIEGANGPDAENGVSGDPLERLRDASADLEAVRFDLEAERESLSALDAEVAELEADLDAYPAAPGAELEAVTDDLAECRERKEELDEAIAELDRTIRFNERLLEGEAPSPVADGDGLRENSPPGNDEVVCWTCGSTVATDAVARTVEQLRTLRDERRAERRTVTERVESLRERRSELEEKRRQRREIRDRLERLRTERDERRDRIADLEERHEDLEATVADLEATVGATEDEDREALLSTHREVNRIEFELEDKREEREAVRDEIADLEAALDRRAELRDRQERLEARIDEQKRTIEEIERDAVAEFNDHMARVLDILEYTKLSRIWIERQADEATGGDLPTGRFVLHIERRTDDGTTYEDVIEHLSESEREVTGLVFAFAGYLVHEVYETVPFLLLDSLEAVDAERIRALVNYVRPYTDYLVVALLPEDAQALPDTYHRVTDI